MSDNTLADDLVRVLLDEETIQARVVELAQQINRDYAHLDSTLILVGVLKGSFIFLADLVRHLEVDHVVDFIALSSYDGGQSGNVRLLMDTREKMEDKHVLIVEDILDSGNTLDYLMRNFRTRGEERAHGSPPGQARPPHPAHRHRLPGLHHPRCVGGRLRVGLQREV